MLKILLVMLPLAVEVVWRIVFTILGARMHPKLDSSLAHDAETAPSKEMIPVDERGGPNGKVGWVRAVEIVYILYHFPVVVPATMLSRTNTCPNWAMWLTPLLYGGVAYMALTLAEV